MAKSLLPSTWENGFREPRQDASWAIESRIPKDAGDEGPSYTTPPSSEILTSEVHNELGLNVLRTWPTIYDGTNTPHDLPYWWAPSSEVDVLICGGELRPKSSRIDLVINTWQLVLVAFRWLSAL